MKLIKISKEVVFECSVEQVTIDSVYTKAKVIQSCDGEIHRGDVFYIEVPINYFEITPVEDELFTLRQSEWLFETKTIIEQIRTHRSVINHKFIENE